MSYEPERGDFAWFNFSPQTGHEQAGHRPALVLSPLKYNRRNGTVLVCPVTTKNKPYPFNVPIHANPKVSGFVMSDQVTCLDWRARKAEFIDKADPGILDEVLERISALLMI